MPRQLVRFYDGAYPAEDASAFIAAGLLAGDTGIVMLAQPHRQAVEQCLQACRMLNTPTPACSGHCLVLDTGDAMARLMVNGRLDMGQAAKSFGALLSPSSHGGRGCVRFVGDRAPELFAAGNEEDAAALEALVGRLSAALGELVFSPYPRDLDGHGTTPSLFRRYAEQRYAEHPVAESQG